MNRPMSIFTLIFLTAILYVPQYALAQNKVVVIPLNTAKKLNNIVTVSAKGGDFTNPVNAINSIANASASNPYLVVIGPGIYTLSQSLVMKEYVTISGAGEKATILSGAISSAGNDAASSLIVGANSATLQWLTVRNTGGAAAYACGIYNDNASPIIQNVLIEVSGGSSRNTGIITSNATPVIKDSSINVSGGVDNFAVYNNSNGSPELVNLSITCSSGSNNNWGIYSSSATPVLQDITIECTGGVYSVGVYNYSSSISPVNLNASCSGGSTGNYGMYSYSSTYNIRRSTLNGDAPGAGLYTSGGTVYVSQSTITGGVMGSSKFCVASDNGLGVALTEIGCN